MATPESRAARFAPDTDIHKVWEDLLEKRKVEQQDAIRRGLIPAPDAKYSLDDAITIIGTCEEKCPYFECIRRHEQNEMKRFEMDPNNKLEPMYSRMVKSWTRPTDLGENRLPLPSDFRTPTALKKTTDYLFHDLLDESLSFVNVHEFIFDRTRSIRQDFSTQQYPHLEIAVECHERIARFHIISLHEMRWPLAPYEVSNEDELAMEPESRKEYSAHLEMKELHKTLTSLGQLYDDLRAHNKSSPNEYEFRAYQAIAQTNFEAGRQLQRLPFSILSHPVFQTALEIRSLLAVPNVLPRQSKALPNTLTRLLKLLQSPQTSFLMACLVESQLPRLRKAWLAAFAKSTGVRTAPIPEVMRIFKLDDRDQINEILKDTELEVQSISGTDNIVVSKGSADTIVKAAARDILRRAPFIEAMKTDETLGTYIDGSFANKIRTVATSDQHPKSTAATHHQPLSAPSAGIWSSTPSVSFQPPKPDYSPGESLTTSSQSTFLHLPSNSKGFGTTEISRFGFTKHLTAVTVSRTSLNDHEPQRAPTFNLPNPTAIPRDFAHTSDNTRLGQGSSSGFLDHKPKLLPRFLKNEGHSHVQEGFTSQEAQGANLVNKEQVTAGAVPSHPLGASLAVSLFLLLVRGVAWSEVARSLADEVHRRRCLNTFWVTWRSLARSRRIRRLNDQRLVLERMHRRQRLRESLSHDNVDGLNEQPILKQELVRVDSHRRGTISTDLHDLLVDQSNSNSLTWSRGSFCESLSRRFLAITHGSTIPTHCGIWLVVNTDKQSTAEWLWTKFDVPAYSQGQPVIHLQIGRSHPPQTTVIHPMLLIFELSPLLFLSSGDEKRASIWEKELGRLDAILNSPHSDQHFRLSLLILYWNDGMESINEARNELIWHIRDWTRRQRNSDFSLNQLSLVGFTSNQDYEIAFRQGVEALDLDIPGELAEMTNWPELVEAYYNVWKTALNDGLEVIRELEMELNKTRWAAIGSLISILAQGLDHMRQDLQAIAGVDLTVTSVRVEIGGVYDEHSLREQLLLYAKQSLFQNTDGWLNWSENMKLLMAPQGMSEDEFPYERFIRNIGDQVSCRLSSLRDTVNGRTWTEKINSFQTALRNAIEGIRKTRESSWAARESRKRAASDMMLTPAWKKMKALDILDKNSDGPSPPSGKPESLQELDSMLIEAEELLAAIS